MKHSYMLALFLMLIWGCNSSGSKQGNTLDNCPQVATLQIENGDTITVVDMNLFNKEVVTIPLSELLDDFQIIKLDDRPEALVKAGMTFVSDDYIGFGARQYNSSIPYKLFDRQGNFLSVIGSSGQGPGEYVSMYEHHIDNKNGRVYILPWNSNSILGYDLKGNHVISIPLPYLVPKGIMYVDGDKERVYMGLLPFSERNIDAVFWEQDFQGNIIQQIEPSHMAVYPDYSNEVMSFKNTPEKDFYIFYWEPRQDSLYHYDEVGKRLKPVFTVDFKEDVVMHDYAELPGYYLANITTDMKQVEWGWETELPAFEMIIDKKTLKGTYYRLVNDYIGNMPVDYPMGCFYNGHFVMNMDPADLHEQLENHLEENSGLKKEERDYLSKLYKSISPENDNNYILIGKLKAESNPIRFMTEQEKREGLSLSVPEPKANPEPSAPVVSLAIDEDTTIYEMPFNTPYLETWKTYFPANNKFKDWPKSDERMVMVGAIIEKSGKAIRVQVQKSSGEAKLDVEAVRLIEEAPIEPAINEDGDPVRSKFIIPVYFPPR